MRTIPTRHAQQRYRQNCATGPGLVDELDSARPANKRQLSRLKNESRTTVRKDRRGQGGRLLISRRGTVFVTRDYGNTRLVITCYAFPYNRS